MKTDNNIFDFDKVFQQKFNDAKIKAPENAFANIQQGLSQVPQQNILQQFLDKISNWPVALKTTVGITTIAIITSTVYLLNNSIPKETNKHQKENLNQEKISNITKAAEPILNNKQEKTTETVLKGNEAINKENSSIDQSSPNAYQQNNKENNAPFIIDDNHANSSHSLNNNAHSESSQNQTPKELFNEKQISLEIVKDKFCKYEKVRCEVANSDNKIYFWRTGNGKIIKDQVFNYSYPLGGEYTIQAYFVNGYVEKKIKVYPMPNKIVVNNNKLNLQKSNYINQTTWIVGTKTFYENSIQLPNDSNYEIMAYISQEGCFDTLTYNYTKQNTNNTSLKSILIPNVITPYHKDGKNDEFIIPLKADKNFSLKILDNNGDLIFYSTNPKNIWNGNNQMTGELVPRNTYFYFITYGNESKQGKITVK